MELSNRLPKNWNEVTVSQYLEIKRLEQEDIESDFELFLEKLAILIDSSSSDSEINDLDVDEVIAIMNSISWLSNEPFNSYKQVINNLSLKEINELKLGEFIDLEHFISQYQENLHIIAAILYKQTKKDEWGNNLEEPYIYNVYKRSELFLNQPITDILGVIDVYTSWRSSFLEANEGLFNDPQANVIENEDQLDQDVLDDIKKENAEESERVKWSWESTLWELSSHDMTKYDKLFDMPVVLVFNTLGMIKSTKNQ